MKSNFFPTIAALAFLVLSMQVNFFQFMKINRLNDELRITQKAKEIETDQSQDLMYQLTQLKAQVEAEGTRQFVAGVVSAVSKPDFYTEIWHSGYDRGVATTQYANNIDLQDAAKKAIPASIKN